MTIAAIILAVALLLGIAKLLSPRKVEPDDGGLAVVPPPDSPRHAPHSQAEIPKHVPVRAVCALPVSLERRPLPDTPEIAATIAVSERLRLAAIIDVETTGFSKADEVIEIAVALIAFDPDTHGIAGIADSYFGRREPGVAINRFARGVHGLTVEDLAGHQIDTEKVVRLMSSAEFIIAHNAPFDRRFMVGLLPVCDGMDWRCSMASIDWGTSTSKKLEDVALGMGIPQSKRHRASTDVATVVQILATKNAQGALHLTEMLEFYEPKPKKAHKRKAAGR